MRSGTCRMLKYSTNVSVPFLIYAVTCWCGLLYTKFDTKNETKILNKKKGWQK